MQNTDTNKLNLLMKIPAIAEAIRAFEYGEYNASLDQRLAAIAATKSAMEEHYVALEAETRAAAERDRVQCLLDIARQKQDATRDVTASAARALNAAMKAINKTGESELMTGLRRLDSWITSMEAEILRLETYRLNPPDQYSQASFDEISIKAARAAYLKSNLPFARQKLNELLALRLAPISPMELKLAVRTALASVGLPDVEMLAEVEARKNIRDGSTRIEAQLFCS